MGSGRRFLIYQLKMAFHQLPVALTGSGMSIWSCVVKKELEGKLFLSTEWLRGHRREDLSSWERRLQSVFRLEKGRLWRSRRAGGLKESENEDWKKQNMQLKMINQWWKYFSSLWNGLYRTFHVYCLMAGKWKTLYAIYVGVRCLT